MSKNWSASRLGTYNACLLKYYYSYVNPYDSNMPVNDELQHKGLCFHETAEQMESGKTREEMEAALQAKIDEYQVDTTLYPEDEALRRLLLFWPEFVTKMEEKGYVTKKEDWVKGEIEGEPFVGALDLHLLGPLQADGNQHIIIYDYKTAKTASAASYKDQLVLYAYLLGKQRGWSFEQIHNNIELFIFFPFSTQKKDNDYDNMLSSVKRINYTADDVEKIIGKDISSIREAHSINWNEVDLDNLGTENFTCRFCQFCGTIPDPETGFKGCKCSYDKGARQVRGLKFHLREEKK